VGFAELALADIVARVAAVDPTPGAGPSLAWACGLAAALVEMVSGISLSQQPVDRSAVEQRQARALALRNLALALADAYQAVLPSSVDAARQVTPAGFVRRCGPRRIRWSRASRPAGEVTRLAADATGQVRGGVRGEAKTAAVLAAAVVEAGVPLTELNLAGAPEDPRIARARAITRETCSDRARALGTS
jgi:hypothetical protein